MRLFTRFVFVCLVLFVSVSQASAQATVQGASSVRPLWQLEIRQNEPAEDILGPSVVSDEARVFYLQGGQIKAVDAATGQQLWTYQIGKWAQLRYSSGWLLAVTHTGKVVALEPKTGRVHWQQTYLTPGGVETFAVQGDLLLVVIGERFVAYEVATGRERWRVRGLYGLTSYPHHAAPSVNGNVVFLELSYHSLTSSPDVFAFDRKTGKRLWKAISHFSPLAVIGNEVYLPKDDYPLGLDYPGRLRLSIFDLRSGKLLGKRSYKGRNNTSWDDIAVTDAVYISGGGNIACFPLSAPGGKAKPNFIRVPRGDVQWLAGPRNGTFLLEWRGALWLVRQNRKPCTPIDLQKQGVKLASGRLARTDSVRMRTDTIKNGMYISLKNGTFYAVNTRTGQVVPSLALYSFAFGPTHVVGSTLIIQTGNKLLAYPLPKKMVRYLRTR